MNGVDIFFVISGFIMVHATRGFKPASTRGGQALDFFVRRLIRVVPLYWLALLWHNKGPIARGGADVGLLADFAFIPRFNPKHPNEIWPSLVPGWTLNYEMLFYVLFAVALFCGRRRYIALVAAMSSLVLAGVLFEFQSAPAVFWTGSILAEFLLGMGVYALFAAKRLVPSTPVAIGLCLLGFVGLAIPNYGLPSLIVDGPFAALIVWSGLYVGRAMRPQRLLGLVGDASYSIYLTHLFVFPFCYALLNAWGMKPPTPFSITVVIVVCCSVATVVGLLVHWVVEKPLLRIMSAAWRGGMRRTPSPART